MKKQSFAAGAALLAIAIGLGKVFSAIFKIPLDRLFLHADGMAIFNSAYNFYMLFFSVATAGIPMAISSLVASAKGKDEEKSILSTSLIFLQVVLTLIAILIFIFADTIAGWTGMPTSAPAFRMMAPALLFCGFTASFKGFFQGKRNMAPAALSQVSDSFGRLFLGFTLVCIFSHHPLNMKATYAISGVPFGAFLSAIILLWSFWITKENFKLSFSFHKLRKILLLAIPITLTSSLHPIFNMVDTLSVVPTLSAFDPSAQTAFGCLSRAATLYALPVSIAGAVSSSILPAVSENLKNNDFKAVNYESDFSIRLALLISIPCSAGFMAISKNIFTLLYNDTANHLTLAAIAPSAAFLSVGGVLACILQGMQKTKYTVISAFSAVTSKFILNRVFLPLFGINGAAYATGVAYLIFVLLLVIFTYRTTPIKLSFTSLVLKPLVCGFLCFITAFFIIKVTFVEVSILCAGLVYLVSIFAVKFITLKEFKQIFGG